MTVIVGVVDDAAGRVHLAADSAGSGGGDVVHPVLKLGASTMGLDERVIFGVAGFMALLPAVLAHVNLTAAPDDSDVDANRWAQATASAITEVAIEHALVDEERRDHMNGGLLMGWRGRLWHITHHLALPVQRYAAIGTGDACAMGAMWACVAGVDPLGVAHAAVAASIAHVDGISGPIRTLST